MLFPCERFNWSIISDIPCLSVVSGPLKLSETNMTCLNLQNVICRSHLSPKFAPKTYGSVKVQMTFFIAEFERAAKIKKIAVYRFLISLLVPEL